MQRIASMSEFWPYYLSEHRQPLDRALHFVGTSWFFSMVAWSFVRNPVWFSVAFAIGAVITAYGALRMEARAPAFLPMAVMLVVATAASPVFLLGVVGAYACAWIGHFRIEKNRPATFKYPVWSFLSDFRMWGHMATGRLWTGDPVAATTAAR